MRQTRIERVKTLSDLFYPCHRAEVRKMIKGSKYLSESTRTIDFNEVVDLDFVLNRGDKVNVYRHFIRAIKCEWLVVTQLELATYLAVHSNLATNPDVGKRTTTIQHFLTIYKENFNY